uniref:Transmembrane protein n=1 Tax=Panagrolaimus sp. ES5 TaxID=591445 RepID=A0AC34EZF2_9BILA
MIIAILVELFAIGWAIASFCACCCRTNFLQGLPITAIIITILLIISMILFGVNHKINKTEGNSIEDLDNVSYSFWLGIGATIVAIIAGIVGVISAWFSHVLC